jgi:hypothetical protein
LSSLPVDLVRGKTGFRGSPCVLFILVKSRMGKHRHLQLGSEICRVRHE